MKVIFPFPDPKLMPNRKNGRNYRYSQSVKNKAKSEGYLLTKKAGFSGSIKNLTITFYTPTNHRRDIDNLFAAMKPYIDGFALAVGVDDQQIDSVLLRKINGVGKQNACVIIEDMA